MKVDRHGYLCTMGDEFKLLDDHWSSRYLSTTDPKGNGDDTGGANGYLSPQPPVFTQAELWHS